MGFQNMLDIIARQNQPAEPNLNVNYPNINPLALANQFMQQGLPTGLPSQTWMQMQQGRPMGPPSQTWMQNQQPVGLGQIPEPLMMLLRAKPNFLPLRPDRGFLRRQNNAAMNEPLVRNLG